MKRVRERKEERKHMSTKRNRKWRGITRKKINRQRKKNTNKKSININFKKTPFN